MDLLNKIKRNGVPLADHAGVKPLYGIKTGLNEAFLNRYRDTRQACSG